MTDIFRARKLVHVKLKKDLHGSLRAALLKSGLTMQEFLAEFCRLYVDGNHSVNKLVDAFVVRKNQHTLDRLEGRIKGRFGADQKISKIDSSTLYDMLDENSPLGSSKQEGEETDVDVSEEED